MTAIAQPASRMTAGEFLRWAEAQPRGRFELVDGQVVVMQSERARHNLAKASTWRALSDAVAAAKLDCSVFTDGMSVVINEDVVREPDAVVQCGVAVDLDSTVVTLPLIVVEVVSPSSERDDTGDKLLEYFSLPSVRHYLIVRPRHLAVVHHWRDDAGDLHTRICKGGDVRLDPPGLNVATEALLGAA